MESKTKGWFLIATLGIIPAVGCVSCGLLPLQSLPSARLGLEGRLDPPLARRVTMIATTPGSYGLTMGEMMSGLPPLNEPSLVQVDLGDPFAVRLPKKVTYCVTQLLAQAFVTTPPPPSRFVLTFSDAPGERYMISGSGRSEYTVLVDDVPIPQEAASWRLNLGPFTRHGHDEAGVPIWMLRVRLTRQTPSGRLLSGAL